MTTTTPPAVEAEGLSRRYGSRWAVAGINLRLAPGRSLLLAGHNGAGKTTLLRLVATALRPTNGALRVGGVDAVQSPLLARTRVGLLGHRNAVYPDLTATENLRVAARLLGLADADARIAELLGQVALEGRAHDPVRNFSAGMRKRLAFARVLLQDAPLVLLDEPYGQLDPAGFEVVDGLLRRLVEEGRAVIVATHLVERGAGLTHAGLVLSAGRMVWVGDAADAPAAMRARRST